MCGLILSDINLTLKVLEEKFVGVVNQVSYRRGYDFMFSKDRSVQDFCAVQI